MLLEKLSPGDEHGAVRKRSATLVHRAGSPAKDGKTLNAGKACAKRHDCVERIRPFIHRTSSLRSTVQNDTFYLVESTVLVKSFSLLEALANSRMPMGLAEVAALTGNTKPTAHRVLQTLIALGYVAPAGGGAYQLTGKLRQLALGPTDRWLAALSEPILRKLHEETSETVNLGVLRHQRIAYVTVIESQHALRRVARVDEEDPVLCTALGRAIASHLPQSAMEMLVRALPVEQRTPKTVIEPAKLRQILKRARDEGYALERDQTDIGVTCLGVPVFSGGQVIAAISISAPTARVDAAAEQRWLEYLRTAVKKLERKLKDQEHAIA